MLSSSFVVLHAKFSGQEQPHALPDPDLTRRGILERPHSCLEAASSMAFRSIHRSSRSPKPPEAQLRDSWALHWGPSGAFGSWSTCAGASYTFVFNVAPLYPHEACLKLQLWQLQARSPRSMAAGSQSQVPKPQQEVVQVVRLGTEGVLSFATAALPISSR